MSSNRNQQTQILTESPLVELDFASVNQQPERLAIAELPFLGHLNVRGSLANKPFANACKKVLGRALPATANVADIADETTLVWYGPSEWLLLTAPEAATELAEQLRQALGETHSLVTDISGGNTVIEISGQHARDLLAKAVTIDVHPNEFSVGAAISTTFAHAAGCLLRVDENVYCVIVRRSFADYIGHWLLDAAKEFV